MEYTESPFWRRDAMKTSEMLAKIKDFCRRYEALTEKQKAWAQSVYAPERMSEFLFQVNNIEGEGFDTLEETQQAIANGALEPEAGWKEDDDRIEHVSCLHRALRSHWFKSYGEHSVPAVSTTKLLASHRLMLESTHPDIAGRFRAADEMVFVRTVEGDKHYFLKPGEIKGALTSLVNKANKQLAEIFRSSERIENLIKFVARFFYEYESIHPFLDGNGRTGRMMMAHMLQSVTIVQPNILFVVNSPWGQKVPFVNREDYLVCFENDRRGGGVPRDITALVIEGIYVGWKRFFDALDSGK